MLNDRLSQLFSKKVGEQARVTVNYPVEHIEEMDSLRGTTITGYSLQTTCKVKEEDLKENTFIETKRERYDYKDGTSDKQKDKIASKVIEFWQNLSIKEIKAMSDEQLEKLFDKLGLDTLAANMRTKILAQNIKGKVNKEDQEKTFTIGNFNALEDDDIDLG